MTPERWKQVKDGFALCFERPEERATLLGEIGRRDPGLRQEIESLLGLYEASEAGAFLSSGPLSADGPTEPAALPPAPPGDLEGRRVGAYRLLGVLGRGGMGVVYRALRVDDEFHKAVAIKIVSGGPDAHVLRQRFLHERQILAGLEHPCIARLLDGGTTDDGLPYFVMELVDGEPLTEYVQKRNLDLRGRLRLFRDVCGAVHHAHRNLVVHRDLKPRNILVTAEGVPKLLDFGIARLVEPGAADRTRTAFVALTPEYASPEQLRGDTITTASDVYSLGVVLFELLTDELPWPPATAFGFDPDRQPDRPSHLLARRAQAGEDRKARRQRVRQVEGDLDTIVLMALRSEPERRYPSVDQLSEDVRRHLDALPVLARPDTLRYRAAKLVRRNPAAAVATVLFALALAGGVAATAWQAQVARAEKRRAEQRFDEVRALAGALVFELHDAIKDLPGSSRARMLVLEKARQHLDGLAADSPEPTLQRELARAYLKLGNLQGSARDASVGSSADALATFRKALALQERAVAAQPQDLEARRERAQIDMEIADVLRDRGAAEEASAHDRRASETIHVLVKAHPDNIEYRSDLASVYEQLGVTTAGDLPTSLVARRRALALCQELVAARPGHPPYERRLAFAHKHVGAVLIAQKELDLALPEYQAALAIEERTRDPFDARGRYDLSFTHSDMGYILWKKEDRAAALASYARALALREEAARQDPADRRARGGVARTLGYIGAIRRELGQVDAAIAAHQRSVLLLEGLRDGDPGNTRLRLDLADKQHQLAQGYLDRARAPGTPGGERRKASALARGLLEAAQPVYLEAEARGELVANEREVPKAIAEALVQARRD